MNLTKNKNFYCLVTLLCTLLITTHAEYYFPVNNRDSIVFIFHGLGDTCDSIEKTWAPILREDAFQNVICVQSGDGIKHSVLSNMNQQVENSIIHINQVYEDPNYKPLFQKGIFFLGLSQGGIIARLVFNEAPGISNFVRRIITFGSPHSGIDSVPGTEYSNVSSFLNYVVQTSLGGWLSSAGFYIGREDQSENFDNSTFDNQFFTLNCNFDFDQIDNLLQNGSFTGNKKQKITEFRDKCLEIRDRYNRLEMFVSVAYAQDQIVNPINSPLFGANLIQRDLSQGRFAIQKTQVDVQNKILDYQVAIQNSRQAIQEYTSSPQFKNSMKDKHHLENLNLTLNSQIKRLGHYRAKKDLLEDDLEFFDGEVERKEYNYEDYKFYTVSGVSQTRAILNNASNFKSLYKTNRLLFCAINAGHLSTTKNEITMLAIRLFGLSTPKTMNNFNEFVISDQPYIDSQKIEALRLYCDFSCLTFPKMNYRRLLV